MGNVPQIYTGADTENLHAQTSTSAFRRSGLSDDELRYASGTWTLIKQHERMIQSTQRKMLRLIIQTKRRYKEIGKRKDETNEKADTEVAPEMKVRMDKAQTHTTIRTATSFENDTDDEIDTTVIEEEERIDYMKRSTDEAMEKMENARIRCWNKNHKRLKRRLALRIASLPSDKWFSESC